MVSEKPMGIISLSAQGTYCTVRRRDSDARSSRSRLPPSMSVGRVRNATTTDLTKTNTYHLNSASRRRGPQCVLCIFHGGEKEKSGLGTASCTQTLNVTFSIGVQMSYFARIYQREVEGRSDTINKYRFDLIISLLQHAKEMATTNCVSPLYQRF